MQTECTNNHIGVLILAAVFLKKRTETQLIFVSLSKH